MKKVIDYEKQLIIFHEDDFNYLNSIFKIKQEFINDISSICFYHIPEEKLANFDFTRISTFYSYRKNLDNFHFIFSNKPSKRQKVIDVFFDIIAPDYDYLIDVERNRANIRILLNYIIDHYKLNKTLAVLDFGCGTGLSKDIENEFNVSIIGYDRCPIMRYFAIKRNLDVINKMEFSTHKNNFFDAAFASYVFHLSPNENSLKLLWNILNPSGILVANFHKNHGLKTVEFFQKKLSAEIIQFPQNEEKRKHGAFYGFKKK